MTFIPWVSGAQVELGVGLRGSFRGDSAAALVEKIVLGCHKPQMKALGFLGAKGIFCSKENT